MKWWHFVVIAIFVLGYIASVIGPPGKGPVGPNKDRDLSGWGRGRKRVPDSRGPGDD